MSTHFTKVKWVAELRFGKCCKAYFFLKVSDIIGKSEFANPLTNFYLGKMGCRGHQPSNFLLVINCLIRAKNSFTASAYIPANQLLCWNIHIRYHTS